MGNITISICDMCGKKTTKFAGKLVLYGDHKPKHCDYISSKTFRSWRLCKRCLNKLTAVQSKGDIFREEIEEKIDEMKVNQLKFNNSKLLLN